MMHHLSIAVPRPFYSLLTYRSEHPVEAGCRVSVPLGHARTNGIVIDSVSAEQAGQTAFTLKTLHKQYDQTSLIDQHLLLFLRWAATYYHHPPGEVYFSAFPAALRGGRQLPDTKYWRAQYHSDAEDLLRRAPKQRSLYDWLRQQPGACTTEQIRLRSGQGWQNQLKSLQNKNLVEVLSRPPPRQHDLPTANIELQLTEEQNNCLQQCEIWCQRKPLLPIYLHGITGSGKTEIYLRLIANILQQGKQVLVLVPEIGLTPQLLQRFRHFFPQHTIVSQHSGLNDNERLDTWLQARNGQAHIVIGTRSTIFTPFAELGLIIIDEEHDLSFKQQEGFRYHARDLAVKRAQMLEIPILMGSATPALESLLNSDLGRYQYTRLTRRPGKTHPPTLEVQDIRGYPLQSGLSEQSLQAIRETLERGEQAMIFINRRGFAPVLLCPSCGWQAQCPDCSSHMTFHTRNSRLICHHCGSERLADNHCPDCSNTRLTTQGQGTERIELMLKQHFESYDVIRIDRDSTSRKGSLQKQLERIHSNQGLVLVGTQMLAKGHDFPKLNLVIILDIDQALLSAEYHALERFGQLMTQVAGRAGRRTQSGRVILQTTQAGHPVLLTLLQHGYLAFARQLLEDRKRWNFPPFGYQALIRANAPELEIALETLRGIKDLIQNEQETGISMLGPVPAPMEKRAGRYRAQLLIQCKNRQLRHKSLEALILKEKNISTKKGARWSIDIDPVELF